MNFYKEQDATGINKMINKEVTNCNKSVPVQHPLYPSVQNTNKRNVERCLHENVNNTANSQIRATRYNRNEISIFPVYNPPKPIKHNLPVVFQPDRQRYVTYKPNTSTSLKGTLSARNLEIGGLSSSDDHIFKKPDKPVTNYKKINNKSTKIESLKDTEMMKNKIIKILTDFTTNRSKSDVNSTNNNNNSLLNQMKDSAVDLDNKLHENINEIEETLQIIYTLSKENPNLITETFVSSVTEILKPVEDNSEIYRSTFIKLAKTISKIFQNIANTVTKAVEQMCNHKYTQTRMQNYMGYTSDSTSSVIDNISANQNAVNNVNTDRNSSFYTLSLQQRRKKPNYQVYHQHQLQPIQNYLPVDKRNHILNSENQIPKDFSVNENQNNIPMVCLSSNLNSAQKVVAHNSPHKHNYNKTNSVPRERIQFQQYQNQIASGIEQQRYEHRDNVRAEISQTNHNEDINRNQISPVIKFETTDGQHEREYLRIQMINDAKPQKRKSTYAGNRLTVFSVGPKPVNENVPLPELQKRQRYENMSNTNTGISDIVSNHKIDASFDSNENIPEEIAVLEIPSEDNVNKEGEKDKVCNESINLDDDEDKGLKINEESLNALLELSQRNKNILMKNYVSTIAEMENLAKKYGEIDKDGLGDLTKTTVRVFQAIVEKLAKFYKTKNPQLQVQMYHISTQTLVQNEIQYMNNNPNSHVVDVTAMQNPLCDVNLIENKDINNPHVQNPREIYRCQPSHQVYQQYHNPPTYNQVQEKQRNTISNMPYVNQMDPRFNRPQIFVPAEHQSSYVLASSPNAHSLHPPQVPHRPLQYGNIEHWNFEQNNSGRIDHDSTQMEKFQQYQAQMMHQQSIEHQRYYQMELQRNAWASQTGNYPPNGWA